MKKKYYPVFFFSVAIWGCSANPNKPTPTQLQTLSDPSSIISVQPTSEVNTADPVPARVSPGTGNEKTLRNGVRVRIDGPTIPNPPCIQMDRKDLKTLKWNVSALNANTTSFHLEVASFNDSKPGCEATTDHPVSVFRSIGPGDFPSSKGNDFILQFEPNKAMECMGRLQLDSQAVNAAGRDHVVTLVINLGPVPSSCAIPPPTPPPPTPVPAPAPLVEGHAFGLCDVQPDEVEIRIHNLGTVPILVRGRIFARQIGGTPIIISQVPTAFDQYGIIAPGDWGGPEQRIREVLEFKNPYFFDGVVYGEATVYTLAGVQIGQSFVLPETHLTCGSR